MICNKKFSLKSSYSIIFFLVLLIGGNLNLLSANTAKKEINGQALDWVQTRPVKFLENLGQMKDKNGNSVPFVLFKASTSGMDLYITEKGLTYVFTKAMEDMKNKETNSKKNKEERNKNIKAEMAWFTVQLKDAIIKKENIIKEGASEEHFNYFLSNCPDGIMGVKQYEKIIIPNVYPGIDWVFYNIDKRGMKYDFIVHPGADPSQIKMIYDSEKPLELNNGEIVVKTQLGTIKERPPYCYLQQNKNEVQSKFTVNKIDRHKAEISFGLEKTSASSTLIIDPQLIWSTFFGSEGNAMGGGIFRTLETDANGNLFAIGSIGFSYYYPLVNAGTYFDNTILFNDSDMLITKFSSKGILLWATFYGGSQGDYGVSAKINKSGILYITGITYSDNFPTQNSGKYYDNSLGGTPGNHDDAFLLKFDNIGNRMWATYFGGGKYDSGEDLVIDSNGNIIIVGVTDSGDLPTKNSGGFYKLASGVDNGFIAEFDALDNFIWGTFWGGNESTYLFGVTADIFDNIYITGATFSTNLPTKTPSSTAYYDSTLTNDSVLLYEDFTIAKFSPTHNLLWSTYYGGSNHDWGFDIITDNSGNVFVMGETFSSNIPVKNSGTFFQNNLGGNDDIFLLKFLPDCSLVWATYYGGTGREEEYGTTGTRPDVMDLDACQNLYIGFNAGPGLVCADPGNSFFDNSYNGDNFSGNPSFISGDEFVAKFDNSGALLWGTYIGGKGFDRFDAMEIDNTGDLTISGGSAVGGAYPKTNDFPLLDQGGGAYFNDTVNYISNLTIMKFYNPSMPFVSSNFVQSASCSCNGKAIVKLNCATPSISYIWSNGIQTLNSSSFSDSIVGLCPGTYSVKVCMGNDTLIETINVPGTPGGLVINPTINNVKCKGGNDGSINLLVTGGASPYTYSWNTSPIKTTSNINGLSQGDYIVTVKDFLGCFNLDTVKIEEPVFALTIDSTNATNITCNGNNNGKISLAVSGGIIPYTYSWNNGKTTSAISGLSPGIYSVVITDGYGCTKSSSANITTTPQLTVNAMGDNICLGETASLTASGTDANTNYTWSPASGLSSSTGKNVTASVTNTTTYTVTGINNNGCSNTAIAIVTVNSKPIIAVSPIIICNGIPATLTANGANTYTWTPNTGLSSTVGSIVTISPTVTTTYSITGTDINGCTNTTSVIVTVNPKPIVSVPSAIICNWMSTTLTATGANTYIWTPNTGLSSITGSIVTASPTVTTTYSITGTDISGCTNTTSVIVTVNPKPVVSVPPAIICNGMSATLTATGATTYTWTPSTGLSSTTGSIVTASPTVTTTYSITGTDISGCTNTTSVIVTVNPQPIITIPPATICEGSSVMLAASGANTYLWSPSIGLSSTVGSSVKASPLITTTYTITGTTGGCTSTTTVTVTCLPLPAANFTLSPSGTILHNTIVSFTDISTGGNNSSWNFGDPLSGLNNTSSLLSPKHLYDVEGNYCITLTSTNSSFCTDTTSKCITVVGDAVISIPNVFTPNGDNVNDFFLIETSGIKELSCTIYDRWGLQMSEWSTLSGNWDGRTLNGNMASDGVYYYVLKAIPADDSKVIEKQGFLQLIR